MRQRAISAAIFVIAMLGGVFGGAKAFYVLFALITGSCLWEFHGLLFQGDRHKRFRRGAGTLLGVLPFLVYGSKLFGLFVPLAGGAQFDPYLFVADLSDNVSPILMSLILLLLLAFVLFAVELFLVSDTPIDNLGRYLLGIVYIGVPFSLLITISYWHDNYAPMRVLGLLLLTWANDTMAYVIGSKIGRTPFFPRISPKKTWEGTLGGMVATVLLALILSQWVLDFSISEWLLLAGIVSVFGVMGDLVESMFKRSLQVKDSGNFLPGHGGFLDRFDSFIFVLPFAWLALMLFEG